MSAADMSIERLEALLRGDEPRTLEEKNRVSLLHELSAAPLAAPDTLHERVLAGAPTARKTARVPSSRRRRFTLVVVPVAVALAVGAAVIHGVLNSSPNRAVLGPTPGAVHGSSGNFSGNLSVAKRPEKTTSSLRSLKGTATSGTAAIHGKFQQGADSSAYKPAGKFGPAGTTPTFAGDQLASPGKNSFNVTAASGRTANTPAAAQALAPNVIRGRLVHADANLVVKVGSGEALSKATTKATQIVSVLGGYAQSVQYSSSHNGSGSSFLDLRVPVGKAELAMGKLAGLGTLVSQQVQTQDLQQQFTHQTNAIGTLKRSIAVYEQALSSGAVTGSQRVETEIKLSNAEHALKSLRKARGRTVSSAATTDITLTLTTNKHAGVVPPHRHKEGRLGRLLGSAARFLALEGIIVLYALVVLSPFIVIGGLAWWLLRERRRRDERLLAST